MTNLDTYREAFYQNPIYQLVLKACAESVSIGDKCSGAYLRGEAIRGLAKRLYTEFRESAKISREEWEKAFAEGRAFRDTNPEESYESDDLNCPACNGSGHVDDAREWLARAEAEGWRSIESAPKDGSKVLIFSPLEGVMSSYWEYQWQGFPWRNAAELKRQEPTLWKPLPAPPKEDGE